MKRLYVEHPGYDSELDEDIGNVVKKYGGEWSRCGYDFTSGIRDLDFRFPAANEIPLKKDLAKLPGIEYKVLEA